MSSSPTIREIAAKLGIGKSTVQRALSGQGNITPATRDHILAAAKKLNYHPDPLFLARQRTRTRREPLEIAYIHHPDARAGIPLFAAISDIAKSLGYRVQRINPVELSSGARLMDVLYHRGHVGVIIGPVRASMHAVILNNTHLPVVCCGRIDELPLHTVRPDITDSINVAWRRMVQAGYRRIGPAVCMHVPPVKDDLERFGAVMACQQDMPVRHRIPPLKTGLRDSDALVAWFRRYQPDAVLGFAVAQYHMLKDAGVDMRRIGFASLHVDRIADAPICGMNEALGKMADEAVHMLDQLIRRRSVGIPEEPLHLLIPSRWIDGETLRPTNPLHSPGPARRRTGKASLKS